MEEKNFSYMGHEIKEKDLDYIPLGDLKKFNLLDFFINEEKDEFIEAENEEAFKEKLKTPPTGRQEDFFASAQREFEGNEHKEQALNIIKQELPVLLEFIDANNDSFDWEEIYQFLNNRNFQSLSKGEGLRKYLRQNLMQILNIDEEVFKDSFYYYGVLHKNNEPVRKADILQVYKNVASLSGQIQTLREVKKTFDRIVQNRRRYL